MMTQPTWIGRTLGGRYQIEELLGQGGMSAVYKATDPNLKRVVAIKLIHPHLSNDREFVQRFEEEAAAVAQLRHPNIIQVFDFNHDGDTYYIVFEFVPGETLQSRLKRLHAQGRPMSLAETMQVGREIGDAVRYAHSRGLVHRDIKPANVMLNVMGQAILMDFGIVKIMGGTQHTATGAVLGTARYMSPEQIKGEQVDARTDIYSLGVLLFEMAGGRPPFEADSAMSLMMMHVTDPVPDLRRIRPDVPQGLVSVINRALAKQPEQRYQTAAALIAALARVSSGELPDEATMVEQPAGDGTLLEAPLTQPAPEPLETQPASIKTKTTVVPTERQENPPPVAPRRRTGRSLVAGGAALLVLLLLGAAAMLGVLPGNDDMPRDEDSALVVETETPAPELTTNAPPIGTPDLSSFALYENQKLGLRLGYPAGGQISEADGDPWQTITVTVPGDSAATGALSILLSDDDPTRLVTREDYERWLTDVLALSGLETADFVNLAHFSAFRAYLPAQGDRPAGELTLVDGGDRKLVFYNPDDGQAELRRAVVYSVELFEPVADEPQPAGADNIYVEYILDASGSMMELLDGRVKLEVAREALTARLRATPPDVHVGLRVYGHRLPFDPEEESCRDIELVVPIQRDGAEAIISWLPGMEAKGMTPMSESIRLAAEDFTFEPGRQNNIILISDGEETCGDEPAEVVAFLQDLGIDFTIHVIGLDVAGETEAQLQRLAAAGGGVYVDADTAEEFAAALETVEETVIEEAVEANTAESVASVPTETPVPTSSLSPTATTLPPTATVAPTVPPPTATTPPTATPAPTAAPQPVVITGQGAVAASSTYNGNFPASLSIDGDLGTSWFSAGPGAGGTTTYHWNTPREMFIDTITIRSNANHNEPGFRTGFGFEQVRIQVLDAAGAVVWEATQSLAGTPDPDLTVAPGLFGSEVVLIFTGHEDPTCGGFSELVVMGHP